MSKVHARRIVHFSSVHSVDDVRVFLKECRSLAAHGYDVTLIARGDTSDTKDGVRRIAVPRGTGGRLKRMLLETLRVARLAWAENADLYHFHDPELIPVGLLLKTRGKAVVYDAHESIRDQILSKPYIPAKLRKPVSKMIGVLEDFAVQRFNGVVTATPKIGEILHTDHTVVAANYPVVEEISLSEGNRPRDPEKVVFVGGFTRIRGSHEMVTAMELVNRVIQARLVICGTMPDSIRAEVEALPGWNYIDDLGWQTREQAQEQRETASCGLCVFHPEPNHVEAVPNKLFEYMGAGLPVVASDFPFWEQFVTDIDTGVLVNPLKPEAIADGIISILSDPENVERMGTAGANAVRQRFNWEVEEMNLLGIYERILS